MTPEKKQELDALCLKFRTDVIETLHAIQTGHPGGSLSVCEILTTLYFDKANISKDNIASNDRDRIVLTKGHAAPMLYRVLAEKGFFPVEEMKTLRQLNTNLQGHPCALDTKGVELSTGPLGIGLSAAIGMAAGLRVDNSPARVFAITGDGELQEGTIWEACMNAAKLKLDNLTIIVDYNGVQLDGTVEEIMPLGDLSAKFKAFGLEVINCDGHDVSSIAEAVEKAQSTNGTCVILAKTVKGKGVSFMEGKNAWHGSPINAEQYAQAMADLKGGK